MSLRELALAIVLIAPQARAHAEEYARIVQAESARQHIDPYLVVALVAAESSWRPERRNRRTGAAGLMQLMPTHWRRWVGRELDPATNLRLGCALLALYLARCQHIDGAISAWNGRGTCRTSVFSTRVLTIYSRARPPNT